MFEKKIFYKIKIIKKKSRIYKYIKGNQQKKWR
jgi:hypothetical protein